MRVSVIIVNAIRFLCIIYTLFANKRFTATLPGCSPSIRRFAFHQGITQTADFTLFKPYLW